MSEQAVLFTLDAAAIAAAAKAAAVAGVRIDVYGDLAEVEGVWRAFETTAAFTPFQSFDWLAKWQGAVGSRRATRPAIVVGRDAAARPLFILPLAIDRRRGLRRLTWLGSSLSDYNAPLLAPGFAATLPPHGFVTLWRQIVRALRAEGRFRFDYADLQKMPETIGGEPNPFLDLAVRGHPSGAHAATLSGTWETFYAGRRSPATRKTDRKKRRRIAEHGEIRLVEPVGAVERERTLEALFRQKAHTFARMGIGNFLTTPGITDFYRSIAADPAMRDLIHFSRLEVGSEIAAVAVGLQHEGRYYLVLSSYHDGVLAQFGPGLVHLHELIARAIDRGFTLFDFTVGDEAYKLDWCDVEIHLHDHLAAGTIVGWPMVAAILAFRRAKRLIKQSPLLWRTFSAARAVLLRRRQAPVADQG